jgi:hypothetical protein
MCMKTPPAFERRIGNRKPVDRLPIDWQVGERPAGFGRRRKKDATVDAQVHEVSITGAAITAPHSAELIRGRRVRIGVGGLHGLVVIKRSVPTAEVGITRYGVEFVEMDPGLTDQLRELVAADRPEGLEERWQQAT